MDIKRIPGYPGYYADLDSGFIYSAQKNWSRPDARLSDGTGLRRVKESKGRYGQLHLIVDGKSVHPLAHRLILLTGVGPCPRGMQACHKNGDGRDNRLCNLRWDSARSNMRDRDLHGRTVRGERLWSNKHTVGQVRMVKVLLLAGMGNKDISAITGVNRQAVSDIKRQRSWRHVTVDIVLMSEDWPWRCERIAA
jgi:hypothetical protein